MDTDLQITSIAHAVQLSVAPVFLIAGIGAMLNVLSNRLSRIVDRGRRLADRLSQTQDDSQVRLRRAVQVATQRANLVHRAIAFCALCALLVCSLVMILFIAAILNLNAAMPVAVLFIAAMTAFILGLLFFLREIQIAIANMNIGPG